MDLWDGLDKEKFISGVTSIAEIFTPLHSDPTAKAYGSDNFGYTSYDRFLSYHGHGKAGNYFNQVSTVAELCLTLQGVVSCKTCFTPYQPNNYTLPAWDSGQYRSTDQSFDPASGLDTSQGDLVNYASWPDVTTSSGYGNDIDDFSWFMAS